MLESFDTWASLICMIFDISSGVAIIDHPRSLLAHYTLVEVLPLRRPSDTTVERTMNAAIVWCRDEQIKFEIIPQLYRKIFRKSRISPTIPFERKAPFSVVVET